MVNLNSRGQRWTAESMVGEVTAEIFLGRESVVAMAPRKRRKKKEKIIKIIYKLPVSRLCERTSTPLKYIFMVMSVYCCCWCAACIHTSLSR